VALIDGEHYAQVVRDTLGELAYEFAAAYVVGGTEKLRGGEDYGVPLVDDLDAALERHRPEVVVDLSDEPVLGPVERFRTASRVLARGLPYVGADFRFEPPPLEPYPLPSISIVGTGKRVGKTAVGAYAARLLAEDRDVVVVAMGRGGPPHPEVADVPPTVERLLELSRGGQHAASDYLEDAVLAQVVTVGCRRCGGGLAGAPFTSNVGEGARIAAERCPDLTIFEGSGASIPPIATDRRVLLASARQPPEIVVGYLNAYRILISDLVVLALAEEGQTAHDELAEAIRRVKDVPVIAACVRPRPVEPVEGRRVAFFSTASADVLDRLAGHLRDEHGADVVHASPNLARRDVLHRELDGLEADVYLVEIKAAAIDVVAEAAAEHGAEVVFADNEVLALDGQPDLDVALRALADAAVAAHAEGAVR
jgi:cyclic 2,3-diphosphoglycerate synthetase